MHSTLAVGVLRRQCDLGWSARCGTHSQHDACFKVSQGCAREICRGGWKGRWEKSADADRQLSVAQHLRFCPTERGRPLRGQDGIVTRGETRTNFLLGAARALMPFRARRGASGGPASDGEFNSEAADGSILDLADAPFGDVQPVGNFARRLARLQRHHDAAV